MSTADRHSHWEHVYETRAADAVSWYQFEPELSLAMIARSGVPLDAPLIDVGGGASVLVDALLDAGHSDLTVLDIAAGALERSRARLGAAAAEVAWIVGDLLQFAPPKRYALWHDRAVFHFLVDADDRARYMETLRRSLRPGGQLIVATFAEDGPERCSGLPVARYSADELHAAFGAEYALLESFKEVHRTPSDAEQRFTWVRLRRRA
jgi:SAM-dependent methyltransferase